MEKILFGNSEPGETIIKNEKKWPEIAKKRPKMTQNAQKVPKNGPKRLNWLKNVKKRQKVKRPAACRRKSTGWNFSQKNFQSLELFHE